MLQDGSNRVVVEAGMKEETFNTEQEVHHG
jgi:hypothetical protein